jgi:hypothetical protein
VAKGALGRPSSFRDTRVAESARAALLVLAGARHAARMPTTDEMEDGFRRLLADNDLPAPDEVEHHADGSIVALWHGPKLAVVVESDGSLR